MYITVPHAVEEASENAFHSTRSAFGHITRRETLSLSKGKESLKFNHSECSSNGSDSSHDNFICHNRYISILAVIVYGLKIASGSKIWDMRAKTFRFIDFVMMF